MNQGEIKARLYYQLNEIGYKISIIESKMRDARYVREWGELVLEAQYLYGIRDGLITACNSLLDR